MLLLNKKAYNYIKFYTIYYPQVVNLLKKSTTPESAELLEYLTKVSLEGLLYAHDRIAEREPLPMGAAEDEVLLDRLTNYPDNSVKIVRIDKTNEPLVCTITFLLHNKKINFV